MTERVPDEISSMLQEYEEDLRQAWASMVVGDTLAVKFSADLKHTEKGPDCKVSINFVKVRIKDAVTFSVDALQRPLFGQED
jgi:hypothetical protein